MSNNWKDKIGVKQTEEDEYWAFLKQKDFYSARGETEDQAVSRLIALSLYQKMKQNRTNDFTVG